MAGAARTRIAGWVRRLRDAANLLGTLRVAVNGSSMEPALRAGDRLLVQRGAFLWRPPRRGEIVVLAGGRYGFSGEVECIKRVVGLPHERITLREGAVLVNDRPLPEPYLGTAQTLAWKLMDDAPRLWALRDDEYLLLGDNRAFSRDSRAFGPVRRRDLLARARYRYNPPQRRGRL